MDLIFMLIAVGFGFSMVFPDNGAVSQSLTEAVSETAPPKLTALPEAPAQDAPPALAALPNGSGFVAEDQTPTGKFTTAGEVRMILDATKGNWVAVREYGGQDLIYFTHLLSWRCGLHEIRFAVNNGPEQVFPAEPCYTDTAQPNAIKAETVLPYATAPLGSVQTITIGLLYDDLARTSETFQRPAILLP